MSAFASQIDRLNPSISATQLLLAAPVATEPDQILSLLLRRHREQRPNIVIPEARLFNLLVQRPSSDSYGMALHLQGSARNVFDVRL